MACRQTRLLRLPQAVWEVDQARGAASGMKSSIFLGNRIGYADTRIPFHLPTTELARHCYVVGKTGMGKTTLLQQMVFSLIQQGAGVGIIDPHGDFAQQTLDLIPPERLDDVVYLDLTDPDHSPALNLVSSTIPPGQRPLVASALISAFRHIWSESWGPRMEYILYHALRSLLDAHNTSLISLPRLLSDDRYRQCIVKQCQDPFVQRFWTHEFETWDKRFRQEAIAPIQNKLGQFVAIPSLRHVFGQVRLRVDFRNILDSGKILIVNLSKGHLGDDASRLTGALLTGFLSSLAMGRSNLSHDQRKNFTLVIDEAQNFLSDALVSILSESRKYGLSLVLSHQFLDQLTPRLQSAVLGNAGTLISFAVAGDDAHRFVTNFGDSFPTHRFADLPRFHALIRTSRESQAPFQLQVAPPDFPSFGQARRIVTRCRQRCGSPRHDVEAKLRRWLGAGSRFD